MKVKALLVFWPLVTNPTLTPPVGRPPPQRPRRRSKPGEFLDADARDARQPPASHSRIGSLTRLPVFTMEMISANFGAACLLPA